MIPGTLSYLSIVSNRRLKAPAFRLVGAYATKVRKIVYVGLDPVQKPWQARSLQFLDVSQNSLDKKSVEYIVAALSPAPESGILSLRLDDCQLRPAALETLCELAIDMSQSSTDLRFRPGRPHFIAAEYINEI